MKLLKVSMILDVEEVILLFGIHNIGWTVANKILATLQGYSGINFVHTKR